MDPDGNPVLIDQHIACPPPARGRLRRRLSEGWSRPAELEEQNGGKNVSAADPALIRRSERLTRASNSANLRGSHFLLFRPLGS